MPGSADGEELAQGGHLAGRRQAADLRQVNTNEVDQPFADKRHVFVGIVEKFSHGQGRARLLAHFAEVTNVLGAERIFQEEEMVRLQVLGHLDRQNGRHALVHVVQ